MFFVDIYEGHYIYLGVKTLIDFYKNKNVLVTGHTGFKGSWLCKVLTHIGANVYGYSFLPNTTPNLFSICNFSNKLTSAFDDVRNLNQLKDFVSSSEPDIVFHLAAQPLVAEGYTNPAYTYETNVMGTVNVLECLRTSTTVKSFVNVTTDKVYQNNEWLWGYRETDVLNGFDPYSNSKSCSELVTDCYKKSFFSNKNIAISTVRAGNVIGGGDFSDLRIIPDCVRAAVNKTPIILRNPSSIRPYQFVLEPIFAYLLLAMKQYDDTGYADCYNVGPEDKDCITTLELVNSFSENWGEKLSIEITDKSSFHESNYLRLDSSKIKTKLGWKPIMDINKAVSLTVDFAKCYYKNESEIESVMVKQIEQYFSLFKF